MSASTSGLHQCPACHGMVPAAPFCGECGAPQRTRRLPLRPRTYAVEPREHLAWPMVTSSIFPRLPDRYRTPFRHGLFLVVAMLAAFSLLRLLGPLVIVIALGIPLLFGTYVWRSDALRDIPARALLIAVALGASIGTGLWLGFGQAVAAAYDIPLGAASQLERALGVSLVVTLAGSVLLVLPALAVRLLPMPRRESLDGFLVGALGALSYAAAGTTSWLAPEFVAGLLDNYSSGRLLEDAILYGLVDPLTGAAAGGSFGLALWFRPESRQGRQPRHIRTLLWLVATVCVLFYTGIYIVDAAELPRGWEIAINTVTTAASMVTLRVGVQAALLYETPDQTGSERVRCEHCDSEVPDMAFCPQCGAASRAISRSARQRRRQSPPGPAVSTATSEGGR